MTMTLPTTSGMPKAKTKRAGPTSASTPIHTAMPARVSRIARRRSPGRHGVAARPAQQHLGRLPGEAERERQPAERRPRAEREVVGDARDPALLVGGQRRKAVGVVGFVHRVRVMGLVVPGDPQPRRQREGQEADPADEIARAAVPHHGAVQRLVADEGGAGEAVADGERVQRRRPEASPAEIDGGDAGGDDAEVERQPGQARHDGIEGVDRQRRPNFSGVGRQ